MGNVTAILVWATLKMSSFNNYLLFFFSVTILVVTDCHLVLNLSNDSSEEEIPGTNIDEVSDDQRFLSGLASFFTGRKSICDGNVVFISKNFYRILTVTYKRRTMWDSIQGQYQPCYRWIRNNAEPVPLDGTPCDRLC